MKDSLGTPRLLDSLEVDHIIHGYIEQRDGGLVVTVLESDREASLSPSTRHRLDPGRMAVGQVALANTVVSEFLEEVGLGDRFDPSGSVIGPGRESYLAGLAASGRRTPAGMREALDLFGQAIALEPQSAAAVAALSSAYALTLYYKYDVGLDAYALASRALAAADSAIAMDPDVASAYSARGYIRALLGMEIDRAAEDFAMAESLAPNQPNGPSWSARILARQGEIEEAFSQARRARDLDPLQAGRRTALASLGFQLGEYDITIDESREALALEPGLTLATAYEGRALALTGRGQECLQLEFGVYELVRALCLQKLGRTADAQARVRAAEDRLNAGQSTDPDHLPEVFAQDLASFYGMIGDVEGSVRWLRYAFDLSPAGVDERLLGSELFDPVRGDPSFSDALATALTRARDRVEQLRAGRPLF
jgi:tetratricopeptide (TPR) repeat protein